MKNNLSNKACVKLLLQQDNILILTHKNPDGDAAGSAGALCAALRRAGKTAYLFPNTQLSEKLKYYVGKFFAPEGFNADFVVSVDVASENMFARSFEGKVDLCLDHHPSNSRYANEFIVKGEKASCGEIILELILDMHHSVTKEEATLLYIAVSTDTGCFRYANTTAATFKAGAKLLELGADRDEVNLKFFRQVSPARIKLEGLINSGMSFHRDGKIAVAIVSKAMMAEAGATEEDTDDLANLPGRAEGNELSILIKEVDDGSKVSLRSNRRINSSDICAVFGGGGHAMAAGCMINSSPEKAKEMLLAVIDELWK